MIILGPIPHLPAVVVNLGAFGVHREHVYLGFCWCWVQPRGDRTYSTSFTTLLVQKVSVVICKKETEATIVDESPWDIYVM